MLNANRARVRSLYRFLHGGDLVIEETPFSNPQFAIEDVIAEGDKVTIRFALTGTWREARREGARMRAEGIAIYRMNEGKIAEHWVNLDRLSLLQQLQATQEREDAVA